jgi:hypothetical protein
VLHEGHDGDRSFLKACSSRPIAQLAASRRLGSPAG